MRILLRLSASLVLLASAGAVAADNPSQPPGPYHSAALGYSLKFPPGWYSMTPLQIPGIPPTASESFCNNPDVNSSPLVCVSVDSLSGSVALGDKSVVDTVRGDEDEDKFSVAKDTMIARGKGKARALEGNNVADGDPQYYYALAISSASRYTVLVLRIEGPPDAMRAADMQTQIKALLAGFAAD
jgi:hypothetical protein